MDRLAVGSGLIAGGVVLLGFFTLAGSIGIGDGVFGWEQILGVIAGGVAVVGGLALMYLPRADAIAP